MLSFQTSQEKSDLMNKVMLKILCIVLGVAIGLSAQNVIFATELTLEGVSDTATDEIIYSQATIDDDFSDNSVLVVMDKMIGGINKAHSISYFECSSIKNIVDLTYIPQCVVENSNNPPEM